MFLSKPWTSRLSIVLLAVPSRCDLSLPPPPDGHCPLTAIQPFIAIAAAAVVACPATALEQVPTDCIGTATTCDGPLPRPPPSIHLRALLSAHHHFLRPPPFSNPNLTQPNLFSSSPPHAHAHAHPHPHVHPGATTCNHPRGNLLTNAGSRPSSPLSATPHRPLSPVCPVRTLHSPGIPRHAIDTEDATSHLSTTFLLLTSAPAHLRIASPRATERSILSQVHTAPLGVGRWHSLVRSEVT